MTNTADTETLLMFMVQDDYDKWAEILRKKREFISFLSELKGIKNYEHMQGIRLGIENGLSVEQIKVYADPKFKNSQMKALRKAFEQGLTIEQVKLFALEDMEAAHMGVFTRAFKNNLHDSQIQQLLSNYRTYDWEFSSLEKQLEDKNKRDQLKELLKNPDCIYL